MDNIAVEAGRALILWDGAGEPPNYAGQRVYRWNGYAEDGRTHSLLKYAETHGERLRKKYLAWIHDLGESRIGDQRLVDHLAFEDGLSYWWMTLLAEKSPYKSPVSDAIRLLALEEIIVRQRTHRLQLVSANRMLHETLSELCCEMGIAYEWTKQKNWLRPPLSPKGIYQALPHLIQAAISLVHYLRIHWSLGRRERPNWFDGRNSIFFCDYFFNVDSKAAAQGEFRSDYWEGLPALLRRMRLRSNWLQLFVPSAAAAGHDVAMSQMRRINLAAREQGFHVLLDACLSWRIILRAITRWLWLGFVSLRLRNVKRAFRPSGSALSMWPLMREEWRASMYGAAAIKNLLWIELFDVALRNIPRQEKGVYLCENISWERALIHAWRKHGHGQLIAAAVHVAVRFWDLRYFADPRTVCASGNYAMPQPDLVALNGRAAMDAYLGADFPKEKIAECEALRYGYMNALQAECRQRKVRENANNILILGDYQPSSTIRMLRMFEAAAANVPTRATYTIKPHPGYMVRAEDYSSLRLTVTMDKLGEIFQDYDVICASNMTAAAVEAYLAGVPLVVMLDESELNFSPLRGQPDVRFVSEPEELALALQAAGASAGKSGHVRNDFFFLGPELPRWQKLLQA